jgi:hypothetical protein
MSILVVAYIPLGQVHIGKMTLKYLYNADTAGKIQEQVLDYLDELEAEGVDIEIRDTSDWLSDKKEELYEQELMPKSIQLGKQLRGKVRSHQAGEVRFDSGVLILDNGFYVGEKALETFEKNEEEFDVEGVHTFP